MTSDGNASSKAVKSDPLANLNLTHDELQRFEKALRQPEFRKLLVEYAEEISNPESRAKYEADIKRLEVCEFNIMVAQWHSLFAYKYTYFLTFKEEKGVDAKFIHPKPGFSLFGTFDGVNFYIDHCNTYFNHKLSIYSYKKSADPRFWILDPDPVILGSSPGSGSSSGSITKFNIH